MAEGLDLEPAPASVAVARSWSRARLDDWGATHLADTVTLLVSELVTNVVLHAKTPCHLEMHRAERLRVAVTDASPTFPNSPVRPDVEARSGRGLLLVDALSDAHGVEQAEAGKRVWFEVRWDAS